MKTSELKTKISNAGLSIKNLPKSGNMIPLSCWFGCTTCSTGCSGESCSSGCSDSSCTRCSDGCSSGCSTSTCSSGCEAFCAFCTAAAIS